MGTPAGAVTEEAALLWLAALQRALGRASHDVKDSLNGVSVNLEVIRSRAARPDAPASAVAAFAEAAGHQLERLTSLIEAVLALGRPEREPCDVALALRRIATVCSASSSNADADVELREADEGIGPGAVTRVRGEVVRLALMAPLLEAVNGLDRTTRATAVQCTIGGTAAHVVVTIGAPGRRTSMPGSVAEVVRAGGVEWTEQAQDLSLAFPRA
jgi:signal transduction histidine kinase